MTLHIAEYSRMDTNCSLFLLRKLDQKAGTVIERVYVLGDMAMLDYMPMFRYGDVKMTGE